MTAEIVVLNKLAVALAADSAASIELVGSTKIYNTTNKLFNLSKYQPVGIMIYGGLELSGVPWEVLIKEFRRKLGAKSFEKLPDYVESFMSFLRDESIFHSSEHTARYLRSVIRHLAHTFDKKLEEYILKPETDYDHETALEELSKYMDSFINWMARHSFIGGYTQPIQSIIDGDYDSIIFETAQSVLFAHYNAEIGNRFKKLASEFIARQTVTGNSTGIVCAGYGTNDRFPRYIEITIDGYFENKPRYWEVEEKGVNISQPALIKPFAQTDSILTFVEGMDPSLAALAVHSIVEAFIEHFPKGIPDLLKESKSFSSNEIEALSEYGGKVATNVVQNFVNLITERAKPLYNAVGLLPKDELAAMAESLISLASFRKKVTLDPETVGGAIDVAVISKGDGFIWIKRKHYFDRDLNMGFVRNYYSDTSSEEI